MVKDTSLTSIPKQDALVKKGSDVKGGVAVGDPKKIPSGTQLNTTKDGNNAPPAAVVKRDVSPS